MARQKGSKVIDGKVIIPLKAEDIMNEDDLGQEPTHIPPIPIKVDTDNDPGEIRPVNVIEIKDTDLKPIGDTLSKMCQYFRTTASIDLTKMFNIDERQNKLKELITMAILIDKEIRGEK
jgi:hypothetical protein